VHGLSAPRPRLSGGYQTRPLTRVLPDPRTPVLGLVVQRRTTKLSRRCGRVGFGVNLGYRRY